MPSQLGNGTTMASSHAQNLEQYPTLKQSLSASLANGSHSTSRHVEGLSSVGMGRPQPPRNVRSNSSLDGNRLGVHSPIDTALAALQYLPMPLLVLSSQKTIILANEAMERLLSLSGHITDNAEKKGETTSAKDILFGQSIAQIGIDIVQEGQRIWVGWEKFLENLVHEKEIGLEDQPASPTSRVPVRDLIMDVVLSSQYIGTSTAFFSRTGKLVKAKLIISIWSLERETHFTLSFTNIVNLAGSSKDPGFLTPSPDPTSVPNSPPKAPDISENTASHSDKGGLSVKLPESGNIISMVSFTPFDSHDDVESTATPSVLQKTARMKDAILDTMEIPVCAMWKDSSLAVPNKAAIRVLYSCTDSNEDEPPDDTYNMLTGFICWTEDFSRPLNEDEYPLVELCKTQKPFKSWRIGVKDPKRGNTVYDCSGECYHDEKTGEFLAGIIALKDVTEYTSALKSQSEENERQFELICHTTPNLLWTTDAKGSRDWFSQRWYDYTGLSAKESLGINWQTPFHPDDLPETSRRWAHSLATGEEYSAEYRCRRNDGQWRWMLGRALPLRDSKSGEIVKWMGSLSDIHDLVEARQAAKRTREQLLNVIKHVQVTVWAIDRHRRLTFLEGKTMWEGEQDDITSDALGKNVYEVFGRYKGIYQKPIEEILNGNTKEQISEHHIDGTGRWFRTRFVPVLGKKGDCGAVDENVVDGVVGVSMDVSEIKEREAELQSQEKENIRLSLAENAAKEASRLKSQFLANMSHEIRTPIAGIIGMAELLIDTPLNKEQKEFGENIQRSANGLLTVINDILDLSKVESGRLDIEEVQFSLSVVIRDVCKMMSFAAERKNLVFESDIQVGMKEDLIVLGDPGRCRQILTNLLTNSIKFTSEGYVKLSVVVKHESSDIIEILFSVEDTGIGIEEAVRKRLFKPFSQADSSTARRFGGTGLGLTICKNLVDLMHGEITLDSVLGTGTKATFSIPFNKAQFHGGSSPLVDLGSIPDRLQSETSVSGCGSDPERISSTPPHSPRELPISNRHHNRIPSNETHPTRPGLAQTSREYDQVLHESERGQVHILVVEDNAINQQIALKTIKKLGFSVSAVWNGREALDYLLEPPTPEHPRPSVILMDVQMPILDGYRATHLIRHHRPYSSLPGMRAIPIVAMTASAIQGDREKCERAGMDDYLAKPVKGKTLEKMLIKWALRGKRHGFHNTSYHSIHTEHDSNCTESEAASSPKAVSHLRFDPSSEDNLRNRAIAEGSRLPSEETEDELGLRSVAAEEKATALRNDKLLNTANEEHMLRYHVLSVPRPSDRAPSLPTAALTAENLAQNSVAAAAQGPPRALHASALPGFGHKGGVLSHSSMAVEGRATSGSSTVGGSGSTVGSLKSVKKAKGNARRRMEIMRNDSEMSQRTVTQQSSMETESEETGSEDVELCSTIEGRSGEE